MAFLFRLGLVVLSTLTTVCLAQFSLWPTIDADALSGVLGLSIECLTALNETVSCPSTLFQRTTRVDYFFWTESDVTTLCTSGCQSSAVAWNELVASTCVNETFYTSNRAVPASTISDRYIEGLALACLTGSDGNSCLVESQDWVGSNWIYAEDGSLADEQPLTSMYDNATLCDECFLNIFTARMNSSYLGSSNWNLYLAGELGNALDWCGKDSNITLAAYTSFSYSSGPPVSSTSTISASAAPTATACPGQVLNQTISARSLDHGSKLRHLSRRQLLTGVGAGNPNISSNCLSLSEELGVPTGSLLLAARNDPDCGPIASGTCLPAPCELEQVGSGANTCAALVGELDQVSGSDVSTVQLLSWNPVLIGTCDDLLVGQYVCAGPPGGAWTPGIANLTSTGGGGGVTQTYTIATTTNNITTPTPIQTGMTSSCDAFHLVEEGDTCDALASEYYISLTQFYAWNPAVQTDCTDLETGIYVCVDIIGNVVNTISTPSPIQTGMPTTCNQFHDVVSGDTCDAIAEQYGISLALFYSWNPAIGTSCADLFLNYYVCVDVIGYTSVSTPAPVQTGMVADCNNFHFVTAGDGCAAIASSADLALASFYEWNPAVGTSCLDLFLSYYVCVGVEFPGSTIYDQGTVMMNPAAASAAATKQAIAAPIIATATATATSS